jgi:hypothetical protein
MAYVGRQPLAGEVIVLDDIQSQFNGVLTSFALTRNINGTTSPFFPHISEQLLVNLGGVIQEPDRTGTRGFNINASNIIFVTPPPAGTECFIISYGNITDLVDYKSLMAPFKSAPINDAIYYTNPDTVNLTTGIVQAADSNDLFTFTEDVVVGNGETSEIGDGETLTINILPGAATTTGGGSSYVLPTATSSILGGVRVGTHLSISSGLLSVTPATISYNSLANLPDLTPNNNLIVGGASTGSTLIHNGSKFATSTALQVTSDKVNIDDNREFQLFQQDTSGTANNSAKIAIDFSSATNGSGNARIRSSINGSASIRPLAFYIGAIEGFSLGESSTSTPEIDCQWGLEWCKNSGIAPTGRLGWETSPDCVYVGGTTSGTGLKLYSGGNARIYVDTSGNTTPNADNSQDLGSSTKRWANIYSADLQLSNEGSVNDVDGTWGNYTIQEGENDLFLLNRRSGKKYKFMLQEVS